MLNVLGGCHVVSVVSLAYSGSQIRTPTPRAATESVIELSPSLLPHLVGNLNGYRQRLHGAVCFVTD